MTFTPAIIKDAYRESNMLGIGDDPSTDQSAEALTMLNRIVAGVYGNEVGDPLFDWPVGQTGMVDAIAHTWTSGDWTYLLPNVRIVAQQTEAQTLYLPPDPADGARVAIVDPGNRLATYNLTLDGNGRTIEGTATLALATDGLQRSWFYRADLGGWVRLADLANAADEEFPFPKEFDDYFITTLAARLNPRYGRALSDLTIAALASSLSRLRARYRQRQIIPVDSGALALTSNQNVGYRAGNRIVRGRMSWMR